MSTTWTIRRRPSEAFGPAPLGFPLTPPVDYGAGLQVGREVTVCLPPGPVRHGVVTAIDPDWITVEVAP